MKKIMIDNRNAKIIAFALVAVLLLIGTVGLASADAMGIDKGSGGLVAYYPFNGDAKDKSGNGNDGTIYGATWVDNGGCGKALSFDGTDDYVKVPSSASFDIIDEITIAAWVYPHSFLNRQNPIFGGFTSDTASKNYISIKKSDGTVLWDQWPPYGGVLESNLDLTTGNWYHVVAVQTPSWRGIYINGQLDSTDDSPEIYSGSVPTNWQIGGWSGAGYYFNGIIDEVCIYNYAKTQSQIQEDMRICTPSTSTATGEPTPATYTKPVIRIDITPCDSTARAVIKAVGGCEAIDKSKYPEIYETCCSKITKEYLLALLNEYLGEGGPPMDRGIGHLQEVLDAYLEMRP